MQRILFCNIAWMLLYKGVNEFDKPLNGGVWVKKDKIVHEAYNFDAITFAGDDTKYCLGYVETRVSASSTRNELHIERINGCSDMKNEDAVDDVLVIWCAKDDHSDFISVVGWYKHATVYRRYQAIEFDNGYIQEYNIIAEAKNCVLLPSGIRHRRTLWYVPRTGKKNGPKYGFGQANIWFANNPDEDPYLKAYLEKMVRQIDEYDGENWLDKTTY